MIEVDTTKRSRSLRKKKKNEKVNRIKNHL